MVKTLYLKVSTEKHTRRNFAGGRLTFLKLGLVQQVLIGVSGIFFESHG